MEAFFFHLISQHSRMFVPKGAFEINCSLCEVCQLCVSISKHIHCEYFNSGFMILEVPENFVASFRLPGLHGIGSFEIVVLKASVKTQF